MKYVDSRPNAGDMCLIEELTKGFFTPEGLPVSFRLNGEKYRGVPAGWRTERHFIYSDARFTDGTITAEDPKTGLRLRAEWRAYRDYPIAEWVLYLENGGSENSPQVTELLSLDASLPLPEADLRWCNGDEIEQGTAGYETFTEKLTEKPFVLAPGGGRPCSRAFSYFRLLTEDVSAVLAVGWPGTWQAEFSAADGKTAVKIGQKTTDFFLRPGETVRTPKITLMALHGGEVRAVNLWRRFYNDHLLPRDGGKPLAPMTYFSGVTPKELEDAFTCCTRISEEEILRSADTLRANGVFPDVLWLDAGWYKPLPGYEYNWIPVGSWEPRKDNFPHGMKAVSDELHKRGIRLLLWFEPERVFEGTDLQREHPEWMLTMDGAPWEGCQSISPESRLFNLGDPEACRWLTDCIAEKIRDYGVDIYRQDFNTRPSLYWDKNDVPGRMGMTENLYVQGYLRFWDELARRNPGVWFDSCASGGQRNDLENIRRAVPLHYSDIAYGNHAVKNGFQQTLNEWFPYYKSQADSWDDANGDYGDPPAARAGKDWYAYHCAMSAFLPTVCRDASPEEIALFRDEILPVWRKLAPLMVSGDYYELTPFHKDPAGWWVRQFDDPDSGTGALHFITGTKAENRELTVEPVLDPDAAYRFLCANTGEERVQKGGLFTERLEKRSGSVWFYQKLEKKFS